MIFQRNYPSRMIRYDTHDAYFGGTASQGKLIVASHRMSRMIDPRASPQQLQYSRQDARIQVLYLKPNDLVDHDSDIRMAYAQDIFALSGKSCARMESSNTNGQTRQS